MTTREASMRGHGGFAAPGLATPTTLGAAAVVALLAAAVVGGAFTGGLAWADVLIVRPLLWLAPLVLVWVLARRLGLRLPKARPFVPVALGVAIVQLALLLMAGVWLGFGGSPYAHTVTALLSAAWFAGSALAGQEAARWYLAAALRDRGPAVSLAVPWAILLAAGLSYRTLAALQNANDLFSYLGQVVVPAAGAGLLATYLTQRGGPIAAAAYLLPLAAFEWGSPILPNLPWGVGATIGLLVPAFGLAFVPLTEEERRSEERAVANPTIGTRAARHARQRGTVAWVVALVAAVVVLAFNTGAFGVRPTAMSGTSMQPTLRTGDLVVARPVQPADVRVGQVIEFREGGIQIIHRVIAVVHTPTGLAFRTKGDNNRAPDPLVPAADVNGRVILKVPLIGWPEIWLRELGGLLR